MNPIFSKITSEWFFQSPFFYEFLARMDFLRRDDIGTAAIGIDEMKITFYYAEDFINTLTLSEIKFLIVHEILHLITLTFTRKENRNLDIWNIATDICNNEEIIVSIYAGEKYDIPKEGWTFSFLKNKYRYEGNLIAEDIYDFLSNHEDFQSSNEGNPKGFDNHEYLNKISDNSLEVSRSYLNKIVEEGIKKDYGKTSGNLIAYIKELKREKFNWRKYLYKIQKRNEMGGSYFKQDTWQRLSRRHNDFPGKVYEKSEAIIIVDSSGSIEYSLLEKFFSHLETITKKIDDSWLMIVDSEIKSFEKYKRGKYRNVKIAGGGGTSFVKVFDFLKHKKKINNYIFFFTDGVFNRKELDGLEVPHLYWILPEGNKPINNLGETVYIS